jgi:rubrerythrin
MDQSSLIEVLREIVLVEIDAARAYAKAVTLAEDESIARMFASFRDEHQREVGNLSKAISDLGGEPPEFTPFRTEWTPRPIVIGNVTNMIGTIEAMRAAELTCLRKYEETGALLAGLPGDSLSLVNLNYMMIQTHLDAIERTLSVGRL